MTTTTPNTRFQLIRAMDEVVQNNFSGQLCGQCKKTFFSSPTIRQVSIFLTHDLDEILNDEIKQDPKSGSLRGLLHLSEMLSEGFIERLGEQFDIDIDNDEARDVEWELTEEVFGDIAAKLSGGKAEVLYVVDWLYANLGSLWDEDEDEQPTQEDSN